MKINGFKIGFVLDIVNINDELDSENVGVYLDYQSLIDGVNEYKTKLKEDQSLTLFVGELYLDPETNKQDVYTCIEYYEMENRNLNKSFYTMVRDNVSGFFQPRYSSVPRIEVRNKGKKKMNFDEIKYVCFQCNREYTECKCKYSYCYDKIYSKDYKKIYDREPYFPQNYYKNGKSYMPDYLRNSNTAEFSYVCEHCFNPLDSCECASYPGQIIEIDTSILPSIRKLNQKGYMTLFCCNGHPWNSAHNRTADIRFATNYKFGKRLPKGWIKRNDGSIEYKYPSLSEGEFVMEREQVFEKFEKWVDSLDNHEEWKYYSNAVDICLRVD